MKILHLGDLHLGKRVNEISMIEDQKFILDQIVTLVKEEKIDVILSRLILGNISLDVFFILQMM